MVIENILSWEIERSETIAKTINVDGKDIIVDDEDFEFLINCYELKRSGEYIVCRLKDKYKRKGMGLYSGLQLQKLLMNPEKTGRSINVDHKDGDEDNYQKDNLRVCTHAQNMKNRKKSGIHGNKQTTSKYKGVSWQAASESWLAKMFSDNKHITIGYYSLELAAASAYNHAARKHHGEFARLNDLGDIEMPEEECEKYRYKKNKTSKYKGVSCIENRWVAQICHESKNIKIGSFDEEEQAARAYDEKAVELKGDKARLNFPREIK